MRNLTSILLLVILFFGYTCNNADTFRNNKDVGESTETTTKIELDARPDDSATGAGLRVSAYLIYDDGTLSTFDVLNDKTKALWNGIGGGGDTLKPSEKTKITFSGNSDSLNIKILNGKRIVVDTILIRTISNLEFIINNTGCSELFVSAQKGQMIVYNDTIPFHCGE